jgi:hypothetical protein
MGDFAMVGKRRIKVDPMPPMPDKATDFMEEIGIITEFIRRLELDDSPLFVGPTTKGVNDLKG